MRLKAEHLHVRVILIGALLIGLSGCVATSRIGDYLVGMPAPPAQPQQLATPVRAGLVLAVPEAESAKPTALTRKFQERLTERVQKWLQEIERYATDGVRRILIGNKCDLVEERKVSKADAMELAKSLDLVLD